MWTTGGAVRTSPGHAVVRTDAWEADTDGNREGGVHRAENVEREIEALIAAISGRDPIMAEA